MKLKYTLLEDFIKRTVAEDIGRGDLFVRIKESKEITAYILAKSKGVFAGRDYIEALADIYNLNITWNIKDGDSFSQGERLLEISGDSRDILSLERSILNIILHASSIATITNKYVKELEGTNCILLDTRKTRPTLRMFEKYAVRCGGGHNHRMGLDDCLMLKDTHLQTIKDLEAFIKNIRKEIPFSAKIEVECESVDMVQKAISADVDIIMCDNMSIEEIQEVVRLRDNFYPHILLEASGNITLDRVKEIANTGVDAISAGSIIHQAIWPDLSMRVEA